MNRLVAGLRNLVRGRRVDRETDEELSAYVAFAADDHERGGLSRAEAERRARLELGGVAQVSEAVRDVQSGVALTTLWRDVTYGVRALSRAPGFSAAVIVVLALGIGANTAIFSLVNGVLLRPIPLPEGSQLVRLFHVPPPRSFPGVKRFSVSPANYLDWKAESHAFDAMAVYGLSESTLTGSARAESVPVARIEPNLFSILRVQPAMGRAFLIEEAEPGRSRVAIVSDGFWRSHFGGAALSGQTLTLDREPYVIVGVMPPTFAWPAWSMTSVSVWVPLQWSPAERAVRGNHNYNVVARLKPGVDLAQASADMRAVSDDLARRYPVENTDWGATVVPLSELIVGDVRQSLLVMLGAVGFVLLIASANAANLILSRTLGRRKEIAIRTALGASRSRVIRQILVETLLLALAAAALGAALSQVSLALVAARLADQLPRAAEVVLDGRVLAFTIVVSIATGIIAGLGPAVRASRTDLHDTLKQGAGRTDDHHIGRRGRRVLVSAEIALSLVLLVGAGLMIRSVWALGRVDPGFDRHHLLTMSIALPQAAYPTSARQSGYFDDALSRIRGLHGVEAAAFIDSLPLRGGSMQPITIDGRPPGKVNDETEVAVRQASPDYLKTMRIPLGRGRDVLDRDAHAVLVSESAAKALWPARDPIGHTIQFGFSPGASWEVVGVVGDVRQQSLDEGEPMPTVYQWAHERPWTNLTLVVRTAGNPSEFAESIAKVVRDLDADQPIQSVTTMDDLVAASTASPRFNAVLLSAFAGVALLLAGVGLYTVLSYAVRGRAREIGIRTALGADIGDVVRMVIGEGVKPTLVGLLIGVVGAALMGPTLRTLVFGVGTSDPSTIAVVALLLAAVAVVAGLAPAYRAARLDPVKVLRDE